MLKFFQGLWDSITGIFKSETIQTLAKVGVSVGLMKHPELRAPVIKASQAVIDRIDQAILPMNIATVETLLLGELSKAKLSKDQQLIAMSAIALYKTKLEAHLSKLPTLSVRTKEIRALAVMVNQAAGGTAK